MCIQGIYAVKNDLNGKMYIGSSAYVRKRWNTHIYQLRHNKHHNKALQDDFNLFGEQSFSLVVLEEVEDKSKLYDREQHFLDTVNDKYNELVVAGSRKGHKSTNETKDKISKSMQGKIRNDKAVLCDDDVLEIKYLLRDSNLSQQNIASMFNITKQSISKINLGKTWKHITLPD